jgi:hypothetical protein
MDIIIGGQVLAAGSSLQNSIWADFQGLRVAQNLDRNCWGARGINPNVLGNQGHSMHKNPHASSEIDCDLWFCLWFFISENRSVLVEMVLIQKALLALAQRRQHSEALGLYESFCILLCALLVHCGVYNERLCAYSTFPNPFLPHFLSLDICRIGYAVGDRRYGCRGITRGRRCDRAKASAAS